MIINISYDSSVASAPAAFKTAINYVINYFDTLFINPVTININVGWGEVNGQPLSGALGQSFSNLASTTYTQITNALVDNSAAANLPASDPTNGGPFWIPIADAKALGFPSANSTGIDGSVGFDSAPGIFTFDPNNRAVPGQYDFIGVAFHEISEVMGRIAGLGSFGYSTMDLFRYSAPGTRQLQGGQPAYFSIDGGKTNLDNFNTSSGGDYGDGANSAGNDAFRAFSSSGVLNAVTSADVALLEAIGWNTVSSQAPTISSIATSGTGITGGNGDLNAGKAVTLTVTWSEAVNVAGGSPILSLNDGGTATYTGGSGTAALTFKYTVAPGQNTSDLVVSSLNLNGATMQDGAGNNADLSGATNYNPAGILQIDTIAPTVAISSAGGMTSHPAQTVSGTVGVADAGTVVTLYDGTTALGTATVQSNGSWSTSIALAGTGTHTLTATDTDAAGNTGTSNAIIYTLEATLPAISASQIQAEDFAITRVTLPLDQATSIASSINSGAQTEVQFINNLLSQVAATTIPAVAVEGSMYSAVGTSAEVTLLATQFLPAQVANATQHGYNPVVYVSEALGVVFASSNETGSTAFATTFGPTHAGMPNSAAGDAAFAAAASSSIFGSASTPTLVNAIENYVSNWKTFFTNNGLHGSADQIDLAARGTAWGDAVGLALSNNLGPLNAQTINFLEDAAQGTAVYSASLSSQPNHAPFQGAATASVASAANDVQLTGVAAHIDHIVM
jgi:hypothetical protein